MDWVEDMARAAALGVFAGVLGDIMERMYSLALAFELNRELERMLGRDFVEACRRDEECSRALSDLIDTSVRLEKSVPPEERQRIRERLRGILARRLDEIGARIVCEDDYEEDDECTVLVRKCYVEYHGERFSVDELARWP